MIAIHFAFNFTELQDKVLLLFFALNLLPNVLMNFVLIVERVANLQWFYTSQAGKPSMLILKASAVKPESR